MTPRRPHASGLRAALRAAASLVFWSVLVLMLAAAPTVTALANVATDTPPRVQTGFPGQAEVLEEEIHVATMPVARVVVVTEAPYALAAAAAVVAWRADAPPTPPPPER